MRYHWNDTFPAGKEKEREVLKLLEARYQKQLGRTVKVWLNDGTTLAELSPAERLAKLRESDIVDELGFKWEVKYDRRALQTGNVFLEHTALTHSGSNFVVYCLDTAGDSRMLGGKNYVTTRKKLLAAIDSGAYKSIHGGNFQAGGKPNLGTLLPVTELEKISYILE